MSDQVTTKPTFRGIDLTGQTFGRWSVIEWTGGNRGNHWLCQCACGSLKEVESYTLRTGKSQSCGCLRDEDARAKRTIHAAATKSAANLSEYRSWSGMINRCTNPNDPGFSNYGGRGISVCDRWRHGENGEHGFLCFLADMGKKPFKGATIERIENDGNYELGNCCWADRLAQNNNKRQRKDAIIVNLHSNEMPLADALKKLNVWAANYYRLRERQGYSPQDAIDYYYRKKVLSKLKGV